MQPSSIIVTKTKEHYTSLTSLPLSYLRGSSDAKAKWLQFENIFDHIEDV